MNIKNIAMWAIIVFLTIGLYNMFKNPQSNVRGGSKVIFYIHEYKIRIISYLTSGNFGQYQNC